MEANCEIGIGTRSLCLGSFVGFFRNLLVVILGQAWAPDGLAAGGRALRREQQGRHSPQGGRVRA